MARSTRGRQVAIKVRRLELDRLVEADLSLLARGAPIIDKALRSWRQFQLPRLVEKSAVDLRAELDYQPEPQQAPVIAAELAGIPDVTAPEIVRDLSGDDVIVVDLIEGVPLTYLNAIETAGLDRHELTRIVLKRNPTMILRRSIPCRFARRNYLALPDGRLGIVDFGQVGISRPSTRRQLHQLLGALVGMTSPTTSSWNPSDIGAQAPSPRSTTSSISPDRRLRPAQWETKR